MLVPVFGAFGACATYLLSFKGGRKAHRYDAERPIFAESGLFKGLRMIDDKKEEHNFGQLERRVFETVDKLLGGDDIDNVPDVECKFLRQLMAGVEYLGLSEAGVSAVYIRILQKRACAADTWKEYSGSI